MKVILVDDHKIFRQGLRSLLEKKAEIEVIGEASDGREAVELAEALSPDVVVMDIAMPGLNGLEAVEQIKERAPKTRVIILSMHKEDLFVFRAFRAGASGYVVKGSAYEELALALEAVHNNEAFISTAISQGIIKQYLQTCSAAEDITLSDKLTHREKELLQLFAEGNSRNEIARVLSISPKTVDRHRENIKEKFGMETDSELFDLARLIGMVGY